MKSPNLQNHLATKKCEHFPMDIKDCFSPLEMTTKPATSPSTLTLLCTMHGMEHLALERDFERIDVAGPFLKFKRPKQSLLHFFQIMLLPQNKSRVQAGVAL